MDAPDDGTPRSPVPGAPSDNTTVTAVLEDLAEEGFGADLRPGEEAGSLVCGACGRTAAVGELLDRQERRLEGASDPDDMVLVVAGRCPACGTGGSVVVGFGPEASEPDAAIVAALR